MIVTLPGTSVGMPKRDACLVGYVMKLDRTLSVGGGGNEEPSDNSRCDSAQAEGLVRVIWH